MKTKVKRKTNLTRSIILKKIKKIGPRLRDLKVTEIYLFGSYARGDAAGKSDIDIIVKCEEGITLFGLAQIKRLLEETLGRSVDLIMKEALRKEFRKHVEEEMIRAA
jgi:predicted nucleotidyltransferase